MLQKYYDGTKLLSMKDINGKKPELFITTGNRSSGKTTYYGRYFMNRFFKNKEKFGLIYRYNYELDDCSDKFYKDLSNLFFPGTTMKSERKAGGIFHELFVDEVNCGYALSLNSSDQIKKYSHLLSDITKLLFDEFQSETNHYCSDEIRKFISLHTSIARGNGEQVKYVPVYMLSNAVTIINPYYVEMGITDRLKNETKFLRGDGYVLEQSFLESVSEAQKASGFNRAFSNNSYVAYSSENVYLNDNTSFIEKPEGPSNYLCTIRYNGNDYGVREYATEGVIYCDSKADSQFKLKIAVTTEDHNINYIMLKRCGFLINTLRYYFEKGCFRFKDLRCKEAILKTLSY